MKENTLLILKVLPLLFSIFIGTTASAATIQAENFSAMSGVVIGPSTTEGGSVVGSIDTNDWFTFNNVSIPVSGNYTVAYRVSSLQGGGILRLEEAGGSILYSKTNIPKTNGWDTWTTVNQIVFLPAGNHNFGIKAGIGGWNLNWFSITPVSSSSSSSKSSSSSSSSSSSNTSINIDRSLIIHDEATLKAADFSLRSTLQQLTNQLNAINPSHTTTADQLFARMWDSQNPSPGSVPGGAKCTGVLNGFNAECRPSEGAQAIDPTTFIAKYIPISLINRLDLRDKVTFQDCGEYRIIYALSTINVSQRNFIIFEAQAPNPTPGDARGCLPIAQFWKNLSTENNTTTRAQLLRNFYFNGIPASGVQPIIDFKNYTSNSGQIRVNMFMGGSWLLKEFNIDIGADGLSLIAPVSVKSNPVDILFNTVGSDPRASAFQQDFINNMNSLVDDFNTFALTVINDQHNNGQSHASGDKTSENFFAIPFSSNTAFRQAVTNKLISLNSNLNASQLINRATAMTCAGCHNPVDYGLAAPDAIGPGQKWPSSLGFTHVNEFVSNGSFPLSPALITVFLPEREKDLKDYLLNNTSTQKNSVSPLRTQNEAVPQEPKVRTKRSG